MIRRVLFGTKFAINRDGEDPGRRFGREEENAMNNRRTERGFTMVELLVVIVVAGIALSLVPIARDYVPELQVNRATRSLAQDLRDARQMAVKSACDVFVTFDVNAGILRYYADVDFDGMELADLVRSRALNDYSEGVGFKTVTTSGVDGSAISAPVTMGTTTSPIAVTFRPNGSVTNPGAVYLAPIKSGKADLGRAVQVLTTGLVQTWHFDAESSPGPWRKWL